MQISSGFLRSTLNKMVISVKPPFPDTSHTLRSLGGSDMLLTKFTNESRTVTSFIISARVNVSRPGGLKPGGTGGLGKRQKDGW